MDVERTIPTWLVVLLSLFAGCVTMYGFFWAQGKVTDDSDFQFLAYAFLLITFIVVTITLGLLIERYKDGSEKNKSAFRQKAYQRQLGRMSSKYEDPWKKALRRRR